MNGRQPPDCVSSRRHSPLRVIRCTDWLIPDHGSSAPKAVNRLTRHRPKTRLTKHIRSRLNSRVINLSGGTSGHQGRSLYGKRRNLPKKTTSSHSREASTNAQSKIYPGPHSRLRHVQLDLAIDGQLPRILPYCFHQRRLSRQANT